MDYQKDNNSERTPEALFPKDFIREEERKSFYNLVVRKAEKVGTALYIITNHIEHTEPIRKEVRNEATALVLKTISLEDPEAGDEFLFRSLNISITSLLSLIKMGSTLGIIAEANFTILEKELTKLRDFFSFGQKFYVQKTLDDVLKGMYAPEAENLSEKNRQAQPDISKRQIENTPRLEKNVLEKKEEKKVPPQKQLAPQSGSRREQITNLIRTKGEVSIKDISDSFSDCSEKTIQREINALIADGVLSKTGERRWSRYSLK